MQFIPISILLLSMGVFRHLSKIGKIDKINIGSDFGSARWANKQDFKKSGAFNPSLGPGIGEDEHGNSLYLPLYNKLTISPPGGGKTTASSIPVLLTHEGPVFVFDVKGELWAVTARYRAETLKRKVIVIDPFSVTKNTDFTKDKPNSLLGTYSFNPFDWLPEETAARDRMMNAFAASFIVDEGGHATHFDENAKILIRGYIDYLMTQDKSMRNLAMVYQLLSENMEEAEITFEQMQQCTGRAAAAANQIKRVGGDERGSILSTSYRQIDWMGDSNLQAVLKESNFDLKDFIKGNMDIYVVLPEDQVKEHNRLVRMLLSLLMGLIIQANPSELPKKKMLFLLEELAQLGYCPDVEQCIEVLRARNVVVWTVFQTLNQIKLFKKPDLFKGAAIKQIFTNDDTETMQWIQTLAGKKTVVTKTTSKNKGNSNQNMRLASGSTSTGQGESQHETGVDLIQLNEIRELPKNKQLVFIQGEKPIYCNKVRYFENKALLGRYDINPLEIIH